jgi:hypothetical protein
MKVLDLQCAQGHTFEGWFASEADFVSQRQNSQVHCPACGDPSVAKKLSAPRLSLSGSRTKPGNDPNSVETEGGAVHHDADSAWLAFARQVVANTVDVGNNFPEEARKIHYGEQPKRAIRGVATREETQGLMDEGIEVVPFPLPVALKGPLQ